MGSIFKVFTLSGINRGSGDRSSAIDLGGKTLKLDYRLMEKDLKWL